MVARTATIAQAADPLASWNDGPAKQAIVEFVKATTTQGSPQFVPPEERIATFDQDGTLWVEHPMYSQVMYCLERVPALVKAKPELANVAPFNTVLELLHGDRAAMEKLTWTDLKKMALPHDRHVSRDVQAEAKKWLAEAKHSRWKKPYTELTYLPMQEVLKYLRADGYKTYIVTGGGQDFVRVYAEKTYGIPPEQIVGTAVGRRSMATTRTVNRSSPRNRSCLLNDNNAGKPERHPSYDRPPPAHRLRQLDRRPADARIYQGRRRRAASLLVLHDDAEREYAYGPAEGLPDTRVGTFTQALYDEAKKNGWTVISMKKDWKAIFAFENK